MRACNHRQIVEGCAECSALRAAEDEVDALAIDEAYAEQGDAPPKPWEQVKRELGIDVPAPVMPALGRHVARPEGFVRVHEGGLDKVAIVSADDARAIAVIRGHLADEGRRGRLEHDQRYWTRIASAHWLSAAADGEMRETHAANAKTARAWAEFYGSILALHVESVAPAAPKETGTK